MQAARGAREQEKTTRGDDEQGEGNRGGKASILLAQNEADDECMRKYLMFLQRQFVATRRRV